MYTDIKNPETFRVAYFGLQRTLKKNIAKSPHPPPHLHR